MVAVLDWLARGAEPLLLRRAAARAASCPEERRGALRELVVAARERAAAALELRRERATVAAIPLLREAAWLLARAAHLTHLGEVVEDDLWSRLDALIGAGRLAPPPEATQPARALFESPDPLYADRLSADDRAQLRLAAEAWIAWLDGELESRNPRQIEEQRRLRLGLLALALLLVGVALVARALGPNNLARGRPVTMSSVRPGAPEPRGATDGVRSRTFDVHTRDEAEPWIAIDLGRPHHIERVVVVHRSDGYWDEALPLALELSSDTHTWREVAVRHERFTANNPWVAHLDGAEARHVRVRKLTRGYLALNELEVYGR